MTSRPIRSGLPPVHPGAILREDVLPALGKSKAEIARLLGISRQHLYDILTEQKPVSIPTALRIGKLCGNGPGLRIRMQAAYDQKIAEQALAEEIAKIPTLQPIDA